jgi:riboflavin synthase
MFTGIVESTGRVDEIAASGDGARLRVHTPLAAQIEAGDSVAVSGACLTAAKTDASSFEADVMNQTLAATSLSELQPGNRVNLELAMRAGDRLGGHLVQGHVDGTGRVARIGEDGIARRLEIEAPEDLRRFIVERGSVTVDGVSLTVAAVGDGGFEISLIPETLERTTLGEVGEGASVNLEVDVIARYVEQLVSRFDTERSQERR